MSGKKSAPKSSSKSPIIIGGCPRSGTTLLRMMIDSHPRIVCGPELKVVNLIAANFARMRGIHGAMLEANFRVKPDALARTFGDQIVALLEPSRIASGKPRVAEKTPQNVHVFRFVADMLPDSPMVHLVRDGRDVVRSLLEQQWMDPETGQRLAYTEDPREAAKYWVRCVSDANFEHPRLLHITYESLVQSPKETMKRVLKHVRERWDDAVLRHEQRDHVMPASEASSHHGAQEAAVHATSIGKWRDSEITRDPRFSEALAILEPELRRLKYQD